MKSFSILLFVSLACLYSVYGDGHTSRAGKGKSGTADARAALRKKLFGDYDSVNIPDDVTVQFGMSLLSLDVIEEKGTLEIDAWLKYTWKDSRLTWDNNTNGINLLRIAPNEVWKPDITLYNSANLKDMMRCWESNPIVYHNGVVLWVPPCQITTHCNFTLDKTPYGEQTCSLKFGSWTYDSTMLDLHLYGEQDTADVDYYGSSEWRMVETKAKRDAKVYPCCPDEAYPSISYNLTIQRIDATFQTCA